MSRKFVRSEVFNNMTQLDFMYNIESKYQL